MRVELKKIQAENAALAQEVQAGREGIAETERRVSSTIDEWKVRKECGRHKNIFKVLGWVFFVYIISFCDTVKVHVTLFTSTLEFVDKKQQCLRSDQFLITLVIV